jgi:hypothetical protein
MRIAIQFFGHLRTFEQTSSSFLQNVVEANQTAGHRVDVFIHTWDELDHSTVNYRNPNGECLTDRRLLESDLDLARSIYQPKKIKIEPQLECDEVIIREKIGKFDRSIKGCLNMAYSLYQGSTLRREYERSEGVKYDWVIVTRPDILFHKEFSISQIFGAYEQFDFEIPKSCIFHAFNPFGRGNMIEEPQFMAGTDLVFVARPQDVDLANSLYEDFDGNIDITNFYCMEGWFGSYWRSRKLNVYPIDFRHGPDFDVLKSLRTQTDICPVCHDKKAKGIKFYSRVLRKALYSLLPYFLVKSSIRKIKSKLKEYEE